MDYRLRLPKWLREIGYTGLGYWFPTVNVHCGLFGGGINFNPFLWEIRVQVRREAFLIVDIGPLRMGWQSTAWILKRALRK